MATPLNNTFSLTGFNNPNLSTQSAVAFPADLGRPPFNYWMSLSFYEYSRPTVEQNVSGSDFLNDLGTIRLPIPNSLVDHQEQNYDAESITSALSAGVMNLGAANRVLGFGGATANPLLAIMYRGPAFKEHSFTWRLAPTSQPESQKLMQIINTIKANQLPHYQGVTLGYPNIVQITLSAFTTTYFSFSYKPAVIKSFEVNYTPEGQPSFFGGGTADAAPTVVEMRMGLTEIEYWTQQDFGVKG